MAVAGAVSKQSDIASSSPGTGRGSVTVSPVSLGLKLLSIGPLLILIVLAAVIGMLTPNFLKPGNLSNIAAQTAVIAIVAIGQHLVILTRGIDLSVGANLALATVVGGLVFRMVDSAPLVMLAMVLSGTAVGAVNGMVYVFGRLPHPVHHHARDAEHLPGSRAGAGDRPHDDARDAGRHRRSRRQLDARPAQFAVRGAGRRRGRARR